MKTNPILFWLRQARDDVPAADDWLSAEELTHLHSLRIDKRRQDWRLGRWTAKCALASYLRWNPNRFVEIEILKATSGAPEVRLPTGETPSISISHRGGVAMCAVGPPGSVLGCDLELIEPRTDAFVQDYFTEGERALIHQTSLFARPLFTNLIWSAKESTLKALHEGLRIATNEVEVDFSFFLGDCREFEVETAGRQEWQPLWVGYRERQFVGWWYLHEDLIHTAIGSWHRPVQLESQFSWPGDSSTKRRVSGQIVPSDVEDRL